MATNTTNYNFKKPDESDFYSVQDQNNNWDKADAALKDLDTPTFEDYSGSTTVPDAATAINNIKSKGKLSTIVSNVKAAFKGACLIGQIVNNCVTNNAKLPLSAAQGKALMDLYTQLNSDLGGKATVISFNYSGGNTDENIKNALYQNWSKIPIGTSIIQFNNNEEIWCGIANKYDASKGSVLMQAAGTGFIKKYIHTGTQLYSLIATDEIKFDGVGKVVFAQNSTATSIRFYTTAVNYLYIEFLTATKNIKFGFYNGSTWTDYWIM